MKINAPKSHPRYLSNLYRDMLTDGVKKHLTSLQGLTAHGRGEAFDYLFGEKTHTFAHTAIEAAAAMLLAARYSVLSVNGNTAVLIPAEMIALSNILEAHLEVNLFHRSKEREVNILRHLKKHGAKRVLLPGKTSIPGIESNRRMIHTEGQAKADVVFVPLEDGDRTQALRSMGKQVITVDLNPLSRTANTASITIVDHIVRTMPLLIQRIRILRKETPTQLQKRLQRYNNAEVLQASYRAIEERLATLAQQYKP